MCAGVATAVEGWPGRGRVEGGRGQHGKGTVSGQGRHMHTQIAIIQQQHLFDVPSLASHAHAFIRAGPGRRGTRAAGTRLGAAQVDHKWRLFRA